MDQPNIIYIVAHDLGRMLGCYGRGFESPNLDRFAAEGALLTNASCASTACSPSRGCAWTGQYAHTNGLMGLVNRGWSLPVEGRTIVDGLNDAGYHTALIGLDHTRRFREDHRFTEYGPADPRSAVVVDHAIEFLRGRAQVPADQPFYLNMGTIEVHGSQWGTHFANREEGGSNPPLDRYGWTCPDQAPIPTTFKDAPQVRQEMANYGECIRYLDFHLGRLFNAIDRLGLRDNTLIMFNTDHGMEGLRGKGTLYELGVEIACMLRGPGIEAGTRVDHLIQNIDYVPTFLEAAGAPIPDEVQGRSFWPALTGEDYVPAEMIFAERNYHGGAERTYPDGTPFSYDPMRSVRTDRYRLIHNLGADRTRSWTPEDVPEVRESFASYPSSLFPAGGSPRAEIELYDLDADPYNWHDIADVLQHASVKAQLLAALEHWRVDTADPSVEGVIPDRLNPCPEAPTYPITE